MGSNNGTLPRVGKCSVCDAPITKSSDSGKCRICCQRKVPYQRIWNRLHSSAKAKNQRVELTFDEFQSLVGCPACHYCGKKLTWTAYGGRGFQGYNLDKIFPDEPYSLENVVPCCWMCNEAKGVRFSYVEFCQLKDGLEEIRKMREESAPRARAPSANRSTE